MAGLYDIPRDKGAYRALPPLVPPGTSIEAREQIIEEIVDAWASQVGTLDEEPLYLGPTRVRTVGVTIDRVSFWDAERDEAIDLGLLVRAVVERVLSAHGRGDRAARVISIRGCDVEVCDFRGLDLEQANIRFHSFATRFGDRARFERARFGDGGRFERATFGDGVRFERASFGHWAGFELASFGSAAGFDRVSFDRAAGFELATFGADARFRGASFGDEAGFSGSSFGPDAGFDRASFGHGARFRGASFSRGACFGDAVFGDRPAFGGASFGEGASFRRARFGDGAGFASTRFGITGSGGASSWRVAARRLWETWWRRGAIEDELRRCPDFSQAELQEKNLRIDGLAGRWFDLLWPLHQVPVVFDQTRVRASDLPPRAREPWSILRRSYTGPSMVFVLLFTVLAFLPVASRTILWSGVSDLERRAAPVLYRSIDRASSLLAPEEGHSAPPRQPWEAWAVAAGAAIAAMDPERLTLDDVIELHRQLAAMDVVIEHGRERSPGMTATSAELDELERLAHELDVLLPSSQEPLRKRRVVELVLGFDWTLGGVASTAFSLLLLGYSLARAMLTYLIAPMREEADHAGITPAWEEYRPFWIWHLRIAPFVTLVVAYGVVRILWNLGQPVLAP